MVTLNQLIENLKQHQGNDHKGECPVYVWIDGKTVPVELGGVSTYGDSVTIFVGPKKEEKSYERPICYKCGTRKVHTLFKGEYCPRCNDWC